MVHRAVFLAAALLSCDAASSPTKQVESPVTKSSAWKQGSRASQEQTIELTFAVKQQGKSDLHDALMRVSKPSSPEYGQHLSNDEVHRMTAPDPAHVEAVMSLIRSHGGEPVAATPNSDMISVKVPIEVAERMLSTKYHTHVHESSGVEITRVAEGYTLPEEVALAVDLSAQQCISLVWPDPASLHSLSPLQAARTTPPRRFVSSTTLTLKGKPMATSRQ